MKFWNHSMNACRQVGLSLVELLVALALGSLILLGIISIFSGSRINYQFQQNSSAVQEAGRIALELMSRDIRMTAFSGCGNVSFVRNRTDVASAPALPPEQRFSNIDALSGVHNTDPAAPDTITIVRASGGLTSVAAGLQATGTTVPVADIAAIGNPVAGSRILLTDCVFTEVGTVASVVGNVITLNGNLVGTYGGNSRVSRHESVRYSVAGNQLLRALNGGANQALIDNVTNLKFTYGIDPDEDRSINQYIVDPATVGGFVQGNAVATSWENVVAINVTLSLNANGLTETFGTTVALRNRTP